MSGDVERLEWPDGELPDQRCSWDLEQAARVFDADAAQGGKRSQIAIYRLPKFILWGQEALAKSMRPGGKDAAATCALELGLAGLRQFPGIAAIRKARACVVPCGDPETMDWFDTFGTMDIVTGGAGTLDKPYKRNIPEGLAKQLGDQAADLGMPLSQLAILALMRAQLGATTFVKSQYQECIVTTLRRFRDILERRAKRAQEYTAATPDDQPPDTREYSIDDVLRRQRRGLGRRPPGED